MKKALKESWDRGGLEPPFSLLMGHAVQLNMDPVTRGAWPSKEEMQPSITDKRPIIVHYVRPAAMDTVNIIYCTRGRGTNQHDNMAISINALLSVISEPCDECVARTASA